MKPSDLPPEIIAGLRESTVHRHAARLLDDDELGPTLRRMVLADQALAQPPETLPSIPLRAVRRRHRTARTIRSERDRLRDEVATLRAEVTALRAGNRDVPNVPRTVTTGGRPDDGGRPMNDDWFVTAVEGERPFTAVVIVHRESLSARGIAHGSRPGIAAQIDEVCCEAVAQGYTTILVRDRRAGNRSMTHDGGQ